jgi:hypothetical protein
MKCANPSCDNHLHYLRAGTLRLLELEGGYPKPQDEAGAFSVRSTPARYFWLCGECSLRMTLRRWTIAGVVLESRLSIGRKPVESWTVKARPAVEDVAPRQAKSSLASLTQKTSLARQRRTSASPAG